MLRHAPLRALRHHTAAAAATTLCSTHDAIDATARMQQRMYKHHARRRRLEQMRAFSSARERAKARAAEELREKNQRMLLYGSALAISTLALCYASVPLYKVFCQATGFGGTTRRAEKDTAELLKPAETSRVIRVTFDGSVSDSLPWSFVPAQRDVRVVPGESSSSVLRDEK